MLSRHRITSSHLHIAPTSTELAAVYQELLAFCLQAMDHSGMFPQTVLVLEGAFAELADSCRNANVLSSNVTSEIAHR
jgi:hypothetical protein